MAGENGDIRIPVPLRAHQIVSLFRMLKSVSLTGPESWAEGLGIVSVLQSALHRANSEDSDNDMRVVRRAPAAGDRRPAGEDVREAVGGGEDPAVVPPALREVPGHAGDGGVAREEGNQRVTPAH